MAPPLQIPAHAPANIWVLHPKFPNENIFILYFIFKFSVTINFIIIRTCRFAVMHVDRVLLRVTMVTLKSN